MYKEREENNNQTTRRLAIVIISTIVVLLLVAIALALTLHNPVGDMAESDTIEDKLAELDGKDLGYDYVWKYFVELGIGSFDHRKIETLENTFNSKYVGKLPKTNEMAYEAARLYLDNFYESTKDAPVETITDALLRCYTRATGDEYAAYRTYDEFMEFIDSMSGTMVGIGIEIEYKYISDEFNIDTITVRRVIEGGGAEAAGVQPGDLLIAVEGVPVYGKTDAEVTAKIRGEVGTSVTITVLRDGRELELTCKRSVIVTPTVSYEILDGNVGYIAITGFEENTAELFYEAYGAVINAGVDGIIFDLRNNLGGYLTAVIDVLSMLVPDDTVIVSTVEKDPSKTEVYKSKDGDGELKLPAVVLCNEYTASAGELFTSAMRDYNDMGVLDATIIGNVTYGKGVMQETYVMLDSSTITLTMAYYNPPSGENYHGVGITPDVILTDPDEQYERALSVIADMIDDASDFPNAA